MATLTVTITESVTLNGKDQGGTYSGFTNSSITQVSRRNIKALQDTEIALYSTADAQADDGGGASWKEGSVKYVRITNLAATSAHCLLTVKNISNNEVCYKLSGKESFLLYSHDGSLAVLGDTADGAVDANNSDIEMVTIEAKSSAQDIELFLASVD